MIIVIRRIFIPRSRLLHISQWTWGGKDVFAKGRLNLDWRIEKYGKNL